MRDAHDLGIRRDAVFRVRNKAVSMGNPQTPKSRR
jgi:hypothetical protein